jgi:DNA-binding MarR family transcriptional regulator
VSTEPIRQGITPERLGSLLRAADLDAQRLRAARSRELGVNAADALALEHLAGAGPLTAGDLGGRLGLTSGGTTALLERLARDGLVERMPHPSDGRKRTLVPTADGLARAREYQRPLRVRVEQAVGWLSPAEREVIGRFLELMLSLTEPSTVHAPSAEHDDRMRAILM